MPVIIAGMSNSPMAIATAAAATAEPGNISVTPGSEPSPSSFTSTCKS